MFKKNNLNNKMDFLSNQLQDLSSNLQKSNLYELINILGNKKEVIKRNLLAGISRGIGIGIGVTLITALLLILLRKIVALNIPVIGEYISDIIDIVEKSR